MRTTTYLVGGLRGDDDATRLWERIADIAVDQGIGAVNVERYGVVGGDGTAKRRDVLNIKHADDAVPDLHALRRAAAKAGRFTLERLHEER